jgi:hypothetical protein
VHAEAALAAGVRRGAQPAVELARQRVEHARVHAGLLADRDGVAEPPGDLGEKLLRARPLFVAGALDPQRERVRAAVPCAEVLGGEIGACGDANVVVDVRRAPAPPAKVTASAS